MNLHARILIIVIFTVVRLPSDAAVAQDTARGMRVFPLDGIITATVTPSPDTPPVPPSLRGALYPGDLDGIQFVEFQNHDSSEYSELISIITTAIAPDSWSNTRNSIELDDRRIIAVQQPEVLDRIAAFLARVETQRASSLRVELALVPPPVLERVAPDWNRPGAPPWLEDDVLRTAIRAAGADAGYVAATTRRGAPVSLRPPVNSTGLVDHDMNCTGVVPTMNPTILRLQRGVFVSLVPYLGPSGHRVRADVVAGRIDGPVRPVETRRLPAGDLELFQARTTFLETTLAGPAGATLVLGSFRAGNDGDASFVGLLRIEPLDTPAPPAEGDAASPTVHVIDVSYLTAPFRTRQSFERPETGGILIDIGDVRPGRPNLADTARLKRRLAPFVGSETGASGHVSADESTIYLAGSPALQGAVTGALAALEREMTRVLVVDLWRGAVDDEALAGATTVGTVLPDSWLARLDLAGERVRVASLGGSMATLASVDARSYVAGVDKASGSTGELTLQVADPRIATAGGGLELRVLATLIPGTSWAQLRVEGELAGPPRFDRTSRARAGPVVEVEAGPDGDETVRPVGDFITIDLPEEDVERWRHLVTVPLGKPILLNALPDASRSGQTTVLVAVVHGFEPPERGAEN